MKFKSYSYLLKNKILYAATVLLIVVCWLFSFSKTWKLHTENQKLSQNISADGQFLQHCNRDATKSLKLDSLLSFYTVDSTVYATEFLNNVSQSINNLPLELIYDVNKGESSQQISTQLIKLKGDYKSLIIGLHRLEKLFFVSRVEYSNGCYTIYLKSIKK